MPVAERSFSIKNLTFSYPAQKKPALNHISLELQCGEFITLCGKSGCGKTTLLRQLKSVLAPHGDKTGTIYFEGKRLEELDARVQSEKIGFVLQSPDNQIVTDKVWHELAFGLESLGYDTTEIRLRVAEMASFFGIQGWFYKNVNTLSGGQKQMLNLAAVMVMQPSVLILDEPTSQLDPIAGADFLAAVAKINRELGVTVIMTEHRLEEAFPLSDRVIVMDEGRIIADGPPHAVGAALKAQDDDMFIAMPAPMRIYAGVENNLDCPITAREGRSWLNKIAETTPLTQPDGRLCEAGGNAIITMENVWFRYEKDAPDVIKGLSLQIKEGMFFALVGGNGTGKSTTLNLISGIAQPYRGEIMLAGERVDKISDEKKFNGLLGVLPQNPQALFVKKTVELDLYEIFDGKKMTPKEKRERINQIAAVCELDALMDAHPYDLSGGEQQRAALAKVLLLKPRILLLDEPTKGLDGHFKEKLAFLLKRLQAGGTTILMVSHDIEFCAKYADRCAMFFDGSVVSEGRPDTFFSGNSFYTTSANRMSRHLLENAVTAEDVILSCGGHVEAPLFEPVRLRCDALDKREADKKKEKLPAYKKWAVGGLLLACAFLIFAMIRGLPLNLFGEASAGVTEQALAWRYAAGVISMTVCAIGIMMLLRDRTEKEEIIQMPKHMRKLSKRTIAAAVMILLLIPLTIYIGVFYLGDRKYYFISLLILLETMLPFFLIFEGRKPQARELMVVAVLCAIAVAGRAAFFWLPQFKPVAAIVIIAAIAFGGETGFITGAMSMFASNMFYGQGPWTPWQMFAMGLIGFLAGVLFKKGMLRRGRVSLAVFGGLTTFLLYGGIMNPASVLMFQSHPTAKMFLSYYITGIPFDLVHACSTVLFMLVAGPAMLEKLDRIKLKYGLIE